MLQRTNAGTNTGIDRHIDSVVPEPAYYSKEDTYVSAAPTVPMDPAAVRMVLISSQVPVLVLAGLIAFLSWQRFSGQVTAFLSLLTYVILTIALGWMALLVVSGKLLKILEMRRKWKTEKARMESVNEMYARRLDTADRVLESWERVELRKLDNDADVNTLRLELAQARSSRASAVAGMNRAMAGDDEEFATTRGRLAAPDKLSATRSAILGWTFALYDDAGRIDSDKVDPETGEILNTVKMPWKAGLCKQRAPEWQEICNPPQYPPVFEFRRAGGNRWYLNVSDYPVAESLERAVGLY